MTRPICAGQYPICGFSVNFILICGQGWTCAPRLLPVCVSA